MFKFTSALSVVALSNVQAKDGLSYVVVGDFTNMRNLNFAKPVFKAINDLKANAVPGSKQDFEFFATVGDNLYPKDEIYPTDEELDIMVRYFTDQPAIKDLPIYPTRGNHDCYFADQLLLNRISAKYPTWKFQNRFYNNVHEIGPNGEKASLTYLDSCLAMCAGALQRPHLDRSFYTEENKNILGLCQINGDWAADAQE